MAAGRLRRRQRRRSLWIVGALAAVSVTGTGVVGAWRIQPYVVRGGDRGSEATIGRDHVGTIDLFDTLVIHEISVEVSGGDLERMVDQLQDDGSKEFVPATVTIDGTRLERVGVRLKGNASLMGLGGVLGIPGGGNRAGGGFPGGGFPGGGFPGGGFPGGGAPDGGGFPGGGFPGGGFPGGEGPGGGFPGGGFPGGGFPGGGFPGGEAPRGEGSGGGAPEGGGFPGGGGETPRGEGSGGVAAPQGPPGGFGGGGGGAFAGFDQLSEDQPQEWPLLLQFDEFVPGQRYQGLTQVSLRTNGGLGDNSLIAEQVAYDLAAQAGEPAPRTAHTGLRVNGSVEDLHVVSVVPDDAMVEREFQGRGVVYKANVGGRFEYVGDDPADYAAAFEADSSVREADLAPLIDFIEFVDTSSDERFANELARRLDIDSFATMLAVRNLTVDTDSIGGSGNNYYLWWDGETGRFTVLTWDANLAFGNFVQFGSSPEYDPYYGRSAAGSAAARGAGTRGLGGGFGQPNTLVDRFLAVPEFRAVYDEAYRRVYDLAYGDGWLARQIDGYAAVLTSALAERPDLLSASTAEESVAELQDFVTRRRDYLATTEPVGR
jgi:spore coat protein CotH